MSFPRMTVVCICMSLGGSLVTRRDVLPGYSYLNITIDKIELKDPQNYIDPFIAVSVKSKCCSVVSECCSVVSECCSVVSV